MLLSSAEAKKVLFRDEVECLFVFERYVGASQKLLTPKPNPPITFECIS